MIKKNTKRINSINYTADCILVSFKFDRTKDKAQKLSHKTLEQKLYRELRKK